jgi:hypothetical protein
VKPQPQLGLYFHEFIRNRRSCRRISISVTRIWTLAAAVSILAADSVTAQAPTVGEINFYGLEKLTPGHILSCLKLRPGDRLPASRGAMEDRLGEIPGVALASVESVCCDGPRVTLFIGVQERGGPRAAFRSDPAGNAVLPRELVETYNQFLSAVASAAAKGQTGEDLSSGHSLMDDPKAWAFQKRFLQMVPDNLKLLQEVLRNGSIASQRAIAAALIGYAPNKAEVIDDLQFALQDPDEAVRANAMRSLTAIAVLASKQPKLGLKIAPIWLVELLNSVVLSDRMESVKALLALTDIGASGGQNPAAQATLDLIRERARRSVIEMARWKTPSYALPPFLLAGRLAGMSYVDTLQQWATGDHEAVLAKLSGSGRKKASGTLQ